MGEIDERICSKEIEFKYGESEDFKDLVNALCQKDKAQRAGLAEMKAHAYFDGFDWEALANGKMEAKLVPNPDEINAPSAKEVEGFSAPKGVTWGPEDQEKPKHWNYFNPDLWDSEAVVFLEKTNALFGGGGSGGSGCCTLL